MSGEERQNEWWREFFSANYGKIYRGPLAGDLSTESEAATLSRIFSGQGPLIDLGCGFGRHLTRLRKQKLDIYGLDFSGQLLSTVPQTHRKRLIRGDLRHLPFADASFSGAIMMFNTFGYFTDAENQDVLREAGRILRPGARLVFDLPSRAGMIAAAKEQPAAIRAQDNFSMTEFWSVDSDRQRLEASGRWDLAGEIQDWRLSVRLYSPGEIKKLLQRAGFAGALEFRPLEDFEELGSRNEPPALTDGVWRTIPNMAVMAER